MDATQTLLLIFFSLPYMRSIETSTRISWLNVLIHADIKKKTNKKKLVNEKLQVLQLYNVIYVWVFWVGIIIIFF